MKGQVNPAIPANVALMYQTGNRTWGETGDGGFLGVAHSPFNLLGREARSSSENMTLHGITLDKLRDRTSLRASLDKFQRTADQRGQMESMDVYAQQAMGILTTSKLVDALDLSKEDPRIVARYGKSREDFQRDGAPPMIENFCVARRLVEAAVPFISVHAEIFGRYGHSYDMHENNFGMLKNHNLPILDRCIPALIEDLESRGLLDSTLVIVMGEMGRSPKVNAKAGRDHWPQCGFCLLAGGGVKQGFVFGETDSQAAYPVSHPVSPGDLVATVYHLLGIDPHLTVPDRLGRPVAIAHGGDVIPEILA